MKYILGIVVWSLFYHVGLIIYLMILISYQINENNTQVLMQCPDKLDRH